MEDEDRATPPGKGRTSHSHRAINRAQQIFKPGLGGRGISARWCSVALNRRRPRSAAVARRLLAVAKRRHSEALVGRSKGEEFDEGAEEEAQRISRR
jgi:hypothetical protein